MKIVLYCSILYTCFAINIKNYFVGLAQSQVADEEDAMSEPKVDMSMFTVSDQIDKIAIESTKTQEQKDEEAKKAEKEK